MINIEMPATKVAATGPGAGSAIAQRIRETITTMNGRANLASHLHSVAHEKSPQRVWQAFPVERHPMVMTWARAGIYDIDLGFESSIQYADGIVPDMDGSILVKEAPPMSKASSPHGWTEHGMDITLKLRAGDMERLLQDPELLPMV